MTNAEILKRAEVLLREAQVIRINQVQACSEAKWPEHLKRNCDAAWSRLNRAHEELATLIPENPLPAIN